MKAEWTGEGIPVVLIHGFLESPDMWGDWLKVAPKGYQWINICLPGHCCGERWHKNKSILSVAEEIHGYLSDHRVEAKKIIGHSLGGYLGLELMQLQKNAQLLLLNSNYWEDTQLKKQERLRVTKVVEKNYPLFLKEAIPNLFMQEKRAELEKMINRLYTKALELNPEDVVNVLLAMRTRKDFSNLLPTFIERLSVLHGEHDPLIKKEVADKKICQQLPDENHFIINDSGHMSLWEQPEMTFQLLNDFLEKD